MENDWSGIKTETLEDILEMMQPLCFVGKLAERFEVIFKEIKNELKDRGIDD